MQFRKSLEPLNANSNRVRSLVVRQLIPNALCHAVVLTLSLGMTAGGEAFAQAKAGTATTLSVAAGGSADAFAEEPSARASGEFGDCAAYGAGRSECGDTG